MLRRAVWLVLPLLLLGVTSATQAQSELARVRASVEVLQDEIDGYLAQLVDTQARADAAGARYWEADLALYELDAEIAGLKQRVETIDAEVLAVREQMVQIAVERYIASAEPPSILAGDDINRQAVADALARFVNEGSLDIIDDYRRAREDLLQAQAALAERVSDQEVFIQQAAAAAAEVQAELAAIGNVYLEIAPRLYEQDRLLDQLTEEERLRLAEELRLRQAEAARRLEAARAAAEAAAAQDAARAAAALRVAEAESRVAEAEASALAAAEASGQSFDPPAVEEAATPEGPRLLRASDGWVCPLAGPFSHFDDFGAPRHYGGWHKGNDLISPTGTPVLAVESGRLEHRANNVGGNSAYIFADSGNYYYNTHLSAYENVGTGWVPAGSIIGYVGDTGNAKGIPHLHFEYHLGGRGNHINPYPIVHDSCF